MLGWSVIVLVTVAWGLGIRAFLWEPETLEVRRIDVESRTWKGQAAARRRASSTSRTWAPRTQSVGRLKSIVAAMNAEHPDIVVLHRRFRGQGTFRRPNAARASGQR